MQKSRHVSHLARSRKPYGRSGVLCPVMPRSCSVLPPLQPYPTTGVPLTGRAMRQLPAILHASSLRAFCARRVRGTDTDGSAACAGSLSICDSIAQTIEGARILLTQDSSSVYDLCREDSVRELLPHSDHDPIQPAWHTRAIYPALRDPIGRAHMMTGVARFLH